MKLGGGLRPAPAHTKRAPHLQRLSFLAVVHPVFGVVTVIRSQTVVPAQMYSEGAGPSAQTDLRRARVSWKSTTNTAGVIWTLLSLKPSRPQMNPRPGPLTVGGSGRSRTVVHTWSHMTQTCSRTLTERRIVSKDCRCRPSLQDCEMSS